MKLIPDYLLSATEASLWWLGQAGYIIRSGGVTLAIDPYLSDSAAKDAPEFSRLYPPPIKPAELSVNIYIVTHDHLDHLDPDTITHYTQTNNTWFVAPRLAAKKLALLGIPENRIVIINSGETRLVENVEITGVFALPTDADVQDTTGYFVKFNNGRNFYHTSDTEFHPLVLATAPVAPEVMLVPINGKWGNPNPEKAALFAQAIQPKYVLPNHYDLMQLNAENPETFQWFCMQYGIGNRCKIPVLMQPFAWNREGD